MLKQINQQNDDYQKSLIDSKLEKLQVNKIPKMEDTNNEFEQNGYVVGAILDGDNEVDFIKYLENLADETHNKIDIQILEVSKELLAKRKVKTAAQIKAEKQAAAAPSADTGDDTSAKSGTAEKTIEEQLTYDSYTPMQIDLEGKYVDFLNFVNKLESSEHYVNVVSFSLEKEAVKDDQKAGTSTAAPVAPTPPVSSTDSKDIFISIPAENASPPAPAKKEEFLKSSIKIVVYTK